MILEAFRSFAPTLVIMDHQLLGLLGEALPMLRKAKENGVLTIYGSRDIKDSPEVVKRHWDDADRRWALNECYDRICVYGQQDIFDPRVAYAPLLDQVKQVDFTGYIVPSINKPVKKQVAGQRKKVLLTFGGGSDGAQRAQRYLEALATTTVHWNSHIITGPLMDGNIKRSIREQAKRIQPVGSVKVQRFHRNIPALLQQVDAVVSMAGYNSCAEILQSGVPAVLLPRSFPRKEQLIRANLLAQRGWVTVLPEENPDPHKLLNAIETALTSSRHRQATADLNGLGRLCEVIIELLQTAGLIENMAHLKPPQKCGM
jgi:predicted glycosyltransferase